MSGSRDSDGSGGAPTRLSLWHRLLLSLPHLKRDPDREPLGQRLRSAMLRPVDPNTVVTAKDSNKPPSVDELENESAFANDKERLVGLLAAPFAGIIGISIISVQISRNPKQFVNGQLNKNYTSPALFHELLLVLLVLAVLMLVTAWFRKRLYLGLVMALYGLTVFNLHWWGFGIPFVMAGAWLLVRAYRAQRAVREATGDVGSGRGRGRGATTPAPRPNKRYTPPTAPPKRPSRPKPEDEQRAG
jgi:hypothetical protein